MKNYGLIIALAFTMSITASVMSSAFASDDGKAEYEKTCIACHASATRLAKKVTGSDNLKKQAFLENFLANHHAADADIRQAIITYLLSL